MAEMVRYDWDPEKAAVNLSKHKVNFEDARTVFEDPLAMTRPDPDGVGEERWVTIRQCRRGGLLLVVHTHVEMDDDVIYIRIISARKRTRHDRRQYEQEAS